MSKFLEDLFGFKDKTAVIIGGTGVLCGEMAQGLAQAGTEVVIVGRNPDKAAERISQIEEAGGRAYFQSCEVNKKEKRNYILKVKTDYSDIKEEIILFGKDKIMKRKGIFPQPDARLRKLSKKEALW